MLSTGFALAVIVAGSAAAAWVGYFRWKDRHRPEPLWLMLCALGGGAAAVALSLLGYDQVDRAGFLVEWSRMDGAWSEALGVALAIGVVEEVAKILPVVAVAVFSKHFDEVLDGAIYAGCAAIGFSLVETSLHAWTGFTAVELLPRIIAAPIAHAMFTAPFGLGIAGWVVLRRPVLLPIGAATAITAHAAYDLALGRSGVPGIVAAGIVGVLWIAFIAAVPKLVRVNWDRLN